jgi:hypothetical protein
VPFRRLVPLRIPSGWAVEFNNFAELDPPETLSAEDRDAYLSQDLLAIRSMARDDWPSSGYVLFVGWYPDGDPAGSYALRLSGAGAGSGGEVHLDTVHAEIVRDAIELCLHRLNEGASPERIQQLLDDATTVDGRRVG